MKHEVLRDFGVTIAGRTYPHGAVVDTDAMVPKIDPKSLTGNLTDDERAGEVQRRQDALAKQAQTDFAAATEAGYFGPYTPPAEASATPAKAGKASKGQEG